MVGTVKNQKGILSKLRIEKLNPMQEKAQQVIHAYPNVVLLSPTGTGKTLAFLLPIIAELDSNCSEIQVLILVPSRELALQIEQVVREMGTGYKVNAVYGGRAGSKDKMELKHKPAILIGTPGRVADRFRRDKIDVSHIKTIVLDEFDKSLEIGFEVEMKEIITSLPKIEKRILTSATNQTLIPNFVKLDEPVYINFLNKAVSQLKIKRIVSPSKDKIESLAVTLSCLNNQPGIVFCNFKDTIQRVSTFLTEKGISHGCFYGGMEQQDRERALIKFRNGTNKLIIATDLAARGLDIPEIKYIIHYQLPHKSEEFTHRNGRTARMNSDGTAYVLHWNDEKLPDFISKDLEIENFVAATKIAKQEWETLFISGGRKDKISKGDIAGLFFKQGGLTKDELGIIEIKQDCAFVAVPFNKVFELTNSLNNSKLKNKKVRISLI